MGSDSVSGTIMYRSPTRRGRQMRRSRWWAHADHPAMGLLAGQRMMSAVLTGGNAGTGTSAVNPIGRLTPAGPSPRTPRLGSDTVASAGHYTALCGMHGAWR